MREMLERERNTGRKGDRGGGERDEAGGAHLLLLLLRWPAPSARGGSWRSTGTRHRKVARSSSRQTHSWLPALSRGGVVLEDELERGCVDGLDLGVAGGWLGGE